MSSPIHTPCIRGLLLLVALSCLSSCDQIAMLTGDTAGGGHEVAASSHGHGAHAPELVTTRPLAKDVEVTEKYVCLINAQKHIVIRAQHKEAGYLDVITVKEGQMVEAGEVLFRINPTLYEARYKAELAEANFAEQEYSNAKRLFEAPDKPIISERELALFAAKLERARANAAKAKAELEFTTIKAPFDGIIDRQEEQQGSLIKEGDRLTTLSDNSTMWVYFNVPEARYLDYKLHRSVDSQSPSKLQLADSSIELVLANGEKFPHAADPTLTIEGEFQRETGNIMFRADFPNPDRVLRHGQTGTVLIHETVADALVIPQRATFEILDRVYVYVVGEDHVVRQREIEIAHELHDVFVVGDGLSPDDHIVLDGVSLIHDGDTANEPRFAEPAEVLKHLKFRAE